VDEFIDVLPNMSWENEEDVSKDYETVDDDKSSDKSSDDD